MFMPPTRLDKDSSSNSSTSEEFDDYEFDGLDNNDFKVKALPKEDLKNIIEETNGDDESETKPKKDEYSFGFSGGYSMQVKDETKS